MRSLARVSIVAAFLMVAGRSARAQTVNGVVVMPDSTTPVAGVIVQALDAKGTTLARALTTSRGTFVLRLAAPGAVDLQVLRIGYRPLKGPALTVGTGAMVTARIVYAAQAISLAAMDVRERETCRVQSDSGLMVARLWEEARKAMLASQLTSGDAPLFAEWIEYDRTLDSTSRTVRRQRVRTSRNATTHAFRSVPADLLKTSGYVVMNDDETNYYAPDADVLLSDAFVNSHCFHLVAPPKTESQQRIGVAFTPTRERRDMKEIEGTLWIDRGSAELRTLEFRYLNLADAAAPARPGGDVQFLRLVDGNWLVSKWALRMPQLYLKPRASGGGNQNPLGGTNRVALQAVQVTGGEVLRALRHDSLVYKAVGAGIIVQIIAPDTLVRLAGARVDLDGTDYFGIADASGRVTISPVLAGRYMARVHTPMMDSLGIPSAAREVEAHLEAHVDSLTLPTAKSVLASACPPDSIRGAEGMLHGWVKTQKAQAVPHAPVTITWKDNFGMVKGDDGMHLSYGAKTLLAMTSDGGYWRACGLPQETLFTVQVVSDSGSDMQVAKLVDAPFAEVNLVLHAMVTATHEIDLSYGSGRAKPHALVELSITDTRNTPLPDATLEILPAGGAPVVVVTGPTGKALAPNVAPGVITVRARRMGYMEGLVTATVLQGRNTIPIIMGAARSPVLDTVRIVGDRVITARHTDFEERRLSKAATASFTHDDIAKRNPVDVWQMLQAIPSVRISDEKGAKVATSTRTLVAGESAKPCYLMVAIDGTPRLKSPADPAFDLRTLPPPDQIYGLEIFAGAASIPLQFAGAGDGKWCGLISIWTR